MEWTSKIRRNLLRRPQSFRSHWITSLRIRHPSASPLGDGGVEIRHMCSRVKSAARDYSRPVRVNVTSPRICQDVLCGTRRVSDENRRTQYQASQRGFQAAFSTWPDEGTFPANANRRRRTSPLDASPSYYVQPLWRPQTAGFGAFGIRTLRVPSNALQVLSRTSVLGYRLSMSTAGSVVHFASAIYTLLDPGDPHAEGRYVAEDFLALGFDCVR